MRDDGLGWRDPFEGVERPGLPEDVRMPYRSGGIAENTGHRYGSADRIECHIDTRPAVLADRPENDVFDQSRHGGVNHAWHSIPHAKASVYMPDSGVLTQHPWVEDKKEKHGMRRIDILAVTAPHDCANHLPE